VILDDHRSRQATPTSTQPVVHGALPGKSWIADWRLWSAATKPIPIRRQPIVIGVDLRNEPFLMSDGQPTGSCWTGDTTVADAR